MVSSNILASASANCGTKQCGWNSVIFLWSYVSKSSSDTIFVCFSFLVLNIVAHLSSDFRVLTHLRNWLSYAMQALVDLFQIIQEFDDVVDILPET